LRNSSKKFNVFKYPANPFWKRLSVDRNNFSARFEHKYIYKGLKKTGIPALAGMDKWDSETISSLSKTETGNLVNRAKNLQLKNHQP
jgi:hypothetical protein